MKSNELCGKKLYKLCINYYMNNTTIFEVH